MSQSEWGFPHYRKRNLFKTENKRQRFNLIKSQLLDAAILGHKIHTFFNEHGTVVGMNNATIHRSLFNNPHLSAYHTEETDAIDAMPYLRRYFGKVSSNW